MYNLLNSFALFISFISGYILFGIIAMSMGIYKYTSGEPFAILIFTIIFGSIFKKIFFSQEKIQNAVSSIEIKTKEEKNSHKFHEAETEDIYEDEVKDEYKQENKTVLETKNEETEEENNVDETSHEPQQKIIAHHYQSSHSQTKSPSEPNFIQKFFAENLLAKIGGLLLFLGVLFLLQLVYTSLGPVGKIIIGFGIGFSIFGIGILLDRKKLITESRVLFGTGILVNYLVILAGRFLIGEMVNEMIFSEGITFLLLIANTIFAVASSLVYRSHILLFFSFLVAYLNPFLIGAEAGTTPYTLVGYSLIVSLGAISLSTFLKEKSNIYSQWLQHVAFIGGNLLILASPFDSVYGWIVKLGAAAILSLIIIFTSYRNKQSQHLQKYFIGSYLVFIALIIIGTEFSMATFTHSYFAFFTYITYLLFMIGSGIIMFMLTGIGSVLYILLLPLLLIIGLVFSGVLIPTLIVPVLLISILLYLGIFVFVNKKINTLFQYAFFGILGVFILANIGHISILHFPTTLTLVESLGIVITTFIFLFSTYYFSSKKDLHHLYTLGTVFSVFMLLPVIQREGDLLVLSICSISGLLLSNIILPFINKPLLKNSITNLVISLALGALFATGEIWYFGEKYFSGISMGLAFLVSAILYFVLGFLMLNKLDVKFTQSQEQEDKEEQSNIVLTFLGVSISLFSLAIAFVFSQHTEIISAIWLFEATLMFFFYSKTKNIKLFFTGIILIIIGIYQLNELLYLVQKREFWTIVPLALIMGSLIANLNFLDFEKSKVRIPHDILHIIITGFISILLLKIIPSYGHGWAIFSIALFSMFLSFIYNSIYSGYIKEVLAASFIIFFIFHINQVNNIFTRLNQADLSYLKILQYISTAFIAISVYIFNCFRKSKLLNFLNISFLMYLFIISTQFVYYFFNENLFVITIYWGLLALFSVGFGIQKNVLKFRTIGLYILSLTVGKVLIYDVWIGLDDAIIRVFALMLTGIIMIILSSLYSRKYGQNLKGEFLWENLIDKH